VLVKLLAVAFILLVAVALATQVRLVALAVVVLEEQAAHKVMLELPIVVAVVGVDKIGLVEMVGLDALLFLFQQQTIQAQQLDLQLL
jgi:hypothetical protein